jgi:hypothetical protein
MWAKWGLIGKFQEAGPGVARALSGNMQPIDYDIVFILPWSAANLEHGIGVQPAGLTP